MNKKMLLGLCVVILAAASCKKTGLQKEDGVADRLFRPTIDGSLTADGNYITASWQKVTGAVTYTVQVSRDTFKTIDQSYTIDSAHITFLNLQWEKLYQVQVRANSADTLKSSKMGLLGAIKTPKFPTILNTPGVSDLTDVAVRVSWATSGATVTTIKILKASDSSVVTTVTLTPSDVANAYNIINGLVPSTNYIIFLYSGTSVRGWANFSTKATLSGNIIDLRNLSGVPTVLFDTLPKIAAGSTILLKRDETYTIGAAFIFTQTVTIMTGDGFGGGPARIALASNFDASGTFDSLHFENVILKQSGASYFMNVGNVAKIGKITFENVTTEGVFSNAFIRLKTTGDEITNLVINNCIIDSIGLSAKYPIIYAGTPGMVFTNVQITNSTFNSIYYFIRQDNTITASSLLISNCTFNDFINQSGYFVNYTTFPSGFNITNTIFGKTTDKTASNFIKSSAPVVFSNCYYTNDCIFSANPITSFSSGLSAYSNASTTLFTAPATSNFKILDATFGGKSSAGDPRWRL